MTPRLLILIVTVIILLFAFLHPTNLAEPEPEQVKTVGVWPTIVADPNPAYARLAFLAALRPRARSAPTKRATMRAASASPPVVRHRWPTGCTAGQSFNAGPCVPASRPCAIPAYICNRESHMTLNVWNHAGSGASGKYQFLASTWAGYGGYPYAAWAPEEVQDARALELWNSPGGHRHWGAA